MLTIMLIMSIFQTALTIVLLCLTRRAGREEKTCDPTPNERRTEETEDERAFREGLRNILRYGGEQ